MKKISKLMVSILCLVGCLFCIPRASAQENISQEVIVETQETTSEKVSEETTEIVEDDSSFETQFKDFYDKWFNPLISAMGGATGCLLTVFLAVRRVKKAEKTCKEIINATEVERAKNEKELFDAKYELVLAKEEMVKYINETKPLLEQALTQEKNISMFKELVALLILNDTNFANNPYASRILNLLDEGCDTNVKEKD